MEVPGRMFGFTNIKLSDDLPLFWCQSSVCRAFLRAIRLCTYKFSALRVRSCELPLAWGSSCQLSRSVKMKIRKSNILPVVLYHSSVRTVCIRTSTEIIIIIWWWCQPLMSAIEAGGCWWRTGFGLNMHGDGQLSSSRSSARLRGCYRLLYCDGKPTHLRGQWDADMEALLYKRRDRFELIALVLRRSRGSPHATVLVGWLLIWHLLERDWGRLRNTRVPASTNVQRYCHPNHVILLYLI